MVCRIKKFLIMFLQEKIFQKDNNNHCPLHEALTVKMTMTNNLTVGGPSFKLLKTFSIDDAWDNFL